MRKAEIFRLTWDKVDFGRKIVIVEHTKNGEARTIPMNTMLIKTLMELKRGCNYVFCKPDGTPCKSVKAGFCSALKRAGINFFRFYDLRHTFASRLVMMGIDLVTVKELLGHKSIAMTMRYSHPSPEHKKMAVELLGIDLDRHQTGTERFLEEKTQKVNIHNPISDNK